jgi:hypothetical protein
MQHHSTGIRPAIDRPRLEPSMATDPDSQRQKFKQELRQRIHEALQFAKDLSPDDCLAEIKNRLLAIQRDCLSMQKSFIVVEEQITCDQYNIGGSKQETATLFRGPSPDASVAICVTQRGSLLYRNGNLWVVYRHVGNQLLQIH